MTAPALQYEPGLVLQSSFSSGGTFLTFLSSSGAPEADGTTKRQARVQKCEEAEAEEEREDEEDKGGGEGNTGAHFFQPPGEVCSQQRFYKWLLSCEIFQALEKERNPRCAKRRPGKTNEAPEAAAIKQPCLLLLLSRCLLEVRSVTQRWERTKPGEPELLHSSAGVVGLGWWWWMHSSQPNFNSLPRKCKRFYWCLKEDRVNEGPL